MQAMNSLDQLQPVAGMGPVGELRLVPDPGTFRVLPYAPNAGVCSPTISGSTGAPAPGLRALVPQAQVARFADRGAVLHVGFENEFTLAVERDDEPRPVDDGLCFSTIGMAASQDYVDALVARSSASGIQLEQYYAELGHGQQEDLHRARAGAARPPTSRSSSARRFAASRRRWVASRRSRRSLGPRRRATAATSTSRCGSDDAPNLFHDDAQADRLSEQARHFIAGVLAHLPGLCGLTAPSFAPTSGSSPHFWAGGVHLLGPGQPGGAGARAVGVSRPGGDVDQRGAQGRGRDAATRTSRSAA